MEAAREVLKNVEGVDPQSLKTPDPAVVADALEKHGHKERAVEIRKDLERLKVQELGLLTEEYRRTFQVLTRQNEDLRKQMEALRHELHSLKSPPAAGDTSPRAKPSLGVLVANGRQQRRQALSHLQAERLYAMLESLKQQGQLSDISAPRRARTRSTSPGRKRT